MKSCSGCVVIIVHLDGSVFLNGFEDIVVVSHYFDTQGAVDIEIFQCVVIHISSVGDTFIDAMFLYWCYC